SNGPAEASCDALVTAQRRRHAGRRHGTGGRRTVGPLLQYDGGGDEGDEGVFQAVIDLAVPRLQPLAGKPHLIDAAEGAVGDADLVARHVLRGRRLDDVVADEMADRTRERAPQRT